MAVRIAKRVGLGRFLLGVALIAQWSVLMLLVARGGPPWAQLLAGVLFTVPLCSLGEWLVHGLLYHGRVPGLDFIRRIHHHGHHFAIFPPERYVQHGPYAFMSFRKPLTPWRMAGSALENALTMYSQVALHFAVGVPLILAPAWLLTARPVFFFSALAALTVISWLLAEVHGAIHTPRDRWIERQPWFQWLDHHHYIHHVDLSANINFMLPICDVLFGTQKSSLTEQEAAAFPTFESANVPADRYFCYRRPKPAA